MADVDIAIIGGGLNGVSIARNGGWWLINRGQRETVTARVLVNASGA